MLSIRSEQLAALREATQVTAFSDVVRWAERAHRGRFAGLRAAETSDLIQRCIANAARYGVDESEAVIQFVGLVFELGEGFEHRPEHRGLRRILEDRGVPGGVRLEVLCTLVAQAAADAPRVVG